VWVEGDASSTRDDGNKANGMEPARRGEPNNGEQDQLPAPAPKQETGGRRCFILWR